MSTPNLIAAKVEAKRAELADAQRRVELRAAELRVWEEAAALVSGSTLTATARLLSPRVVAQASQNLDGHTSMKGHWRAISKDVISRNLSSFGYDDLEKAGRDVGHEINRNTARSQMANYTKAGLVERVGSGQFRFTTHGMAAAGVLSNSPWAQAEGTKKPVEGGAQTTGLFGGEGDADNVTFPKGHYTDDPNQRGE